MTTDIIDKIIAWEVGEMTSKDEVITFFQELIDTGTINHLQGTYGRQAQRFIDMGVCHAPKASKKEKD